MGLTVFPTILFNASTGSDSAASGAGPGTALSGSAAAVTSGSASATITDTVDLSGVATDGSAVLWINTASGRQFSRISAISGGPSGSTWTLTLENSVWTTSTGKTWGIGGKRNSFGATSSRLLFSADALPGWTIQSETDQPAVTSSIAGTASGSTSGFITLQGDSTSTRRLLTSATNNVSPLSGGLAYWRIKNFRFTSTAPTKTGSHGIDFNATNTGLTLVQNCVFGDPVDKLQRGIQRSGTSQVFLQVVNCEIQYCLSYGFDGGGGGSSCWSLLYCKVHDNAGGGGQGIFSLSPSVLEVIGNEFYNNTGIGLELLSGGSNLATPRILNNTFHNNSGDGLKIDQSAQMAGAKVLNNNITKNGGYGINYAGSNGDQLKGFIDFNNFGTGSLANTSGAVNGFTQGPNSLTVDPTYANASTGDFTPSNAATQIAYAVGALL